MNPIRQHSASAEFGFTLVELLVAMSIAAILLMLAAPSFNDAILSNRLASYANGFIASAQLARSEAIKRNAVVRVCRSADGAACATSGDFQQGWIVFHDANNDGMVDTGETVIQAQQSLSAGYHFTSDSYSVPFQATGGSTATALTLCRALPSAGTQERTLAITATGRTSVTTTRTGTCA